MRWYAILLFLLFHSLEGQGLNQMQYIQYKSANLIAQGRMISITPYNEEESKLDFYTVKIQLNQIIKQDFYIDTPLITLRAQFLSKDGASPTKDRFLDSFLKTSWIFFLDEKQIKGTEILTALSLAPSEHGLSGQLQELDRYNRIKVNHYSRNKTCKGSCRLCHHIQHENWNGVKRIISRNARQQKSDALLHHRRIKWVSFDRNILASLPSYMGARMLMRSQSKEVNAYFSYRVGYYKSFCTWLPAILYRLFRVQAYKYFKIERQGTLKLVRFEAPSTAYQMYYKYIKQNDQRLIKDTLLSSRYGPNFNLPDEYVLLADVFDGEFNLYLDYQSMQDYLERCASYIGKLKQQRKVYLLSIITAHTVPAIAEMAINALSELNDPRCIHMLLSMAEFTKTQLQESTEDLPHKKELAATLMRSINSLTRCTNPIPDYNANNLIWARALTLSIPVWSKKLYIVGDEEGFTKNFGN